MLAFFLVNWAAHQSEVWVTDDAVVMFGILCATWVTCGAIAVVGLWRTRERA